MSPRDHLSSLPSSAVLGSGMSHISAASSLSSAPCWCCAFLPPFCSLGAFLRPFLSLPAFSQPSSHQASSSAPPALLPFWSQDVSSFHDFFFQSQSWPFSQFCASPSPSSQYCWEPPPPPPPPASHCSSSPLSTLWVPKALEPAKRMAGSGGSEAPASSGPFPPFAASRANFFFSLAALFSASSRAFSASLSRRSCSMRSSASLIFFSSFICCFVFFSSHWEAAWFWRSSMTLKTSTSIW
mmetsp:Transcript_6684/g.19902  ORF Transcript_6684/g.19902 Transcript_6684/m.19902 type:complete len:240 (+) Transcript_6684:142-861(+)